MYAERRTTRSSKRQLHDHHHEIYLPSKGGKQPYLTDTTILTPPPSQTGAVNFEPRTTRRWRGKRQYEDPFDQPPPTPSYPSRKKTRYGDEVANHSSSLSSDPSCSSSSQDPSMSAFHNTDISLEFGCFDDYVGLGVDGLASDNDPCLGDADNVVGANNSRDLHTPPPMSPPMPSSLMPATPNPRPETPGNSNLTPSLIVEMGSTTLEDEDLDHDDLDRDNDHDTNSLVGMSGLSQFGPPPTPMCPPRVGNLSSSSTSSLLQLSSAIRTTPSTSAAPPINILASDDDDDNDNNNDDDVFVQNNSNVNNHNNKESLTLCSQQYDTSTNNNLTTVNLLFNDKDNLHLNSSKKSPDIINASQSFKRTSPPPSPPISNSMSKHSHRLRIRAPPSHSARSGQRKSEKSTTNSNNNKSKSEASSHSIKSILKTNRNKLNKGSHDSGNKATVNFSKETVNNEQSSSAITTTTTNNSKNKNNNNEGLMLPPKPKPAPIVPSFPLSKQDGALPLSLRTASYPPEISKNKSQYIRDGNIVTLKLINFMAHHNRAWNFNQGVTFINGKNGSGKSAIQLGMKFLVGEKAVNTLRTSSIKFFIKNGYTFADIEGHFTNFNGTVSKKRYGDIIKLRRRIKYTGGSNYTICGADGRWRQIKQHELGVITHSLNIDPNNPFQFLQQDRFKDSSKPGSSQQSSRDFIKFKAATQLTAIEDMLKTSMENVKVAMSVVNEKEDMRRLFSLQAKQLKEQLDQILLMERSQNRLAELENELEWAEVKVLEEEQRRIQEEKAKLYTELTKLEEDKKKLEDDISNFNNMEHKNKKLLKDVEQKIEQLEKEKERKVQEKREVNRTQQRAKSQHSTIIIKIRQYTEEIEKLQRELNRETISYEAENQKYQAEIERCQEMIKEKEPILITLRSQRDRIFEEIAEYKATKRKEEQKIKQLESQLNETNRELNKRDNFGWHMKQLQAKIDKYKHWRQKPIGPLGQGISAPDPKYAPLIEHILYSELFTFVVQTKEDYTKMREFISEVYDNNDKGRYKGKIRNPTLTHMPDTNINDYMQKVEVVKEKLKRFRTVQSMLSFKSPMVELGVIEKTRCERIALFDTNADAAAVMKDSRNFPPELKVGYSLQWYQVNPYPNYQFQTLQGQKVKTDILPMAKGGTTNQINEEIARKMEVIKTCRYNLEGPKGLEQQLRHHDGQINDVNRQINQLKNKIKHAQSCIREEPAQNQDKEVADQIKMVQEMRENREKEIQGPLKELELAKDEEIRINEEIKKIDAQFPELRRKLEELEGDNNGTNRTVNKLGKELDECKARKRRCDKELLVLSEAHNKIYFDMEKQQKRVSQLGPRPKELRAPEVVERELEITKEILNKNKDKLKCKERVTSEYKNRQALVLQITNEINLIKHLCHNFEPLIKVNTDYYEKLKKEMSSQLTSNYKTLVEAHRLTGDLIIDWENETLVYYVCPDKMAEHKAKQSYSKKDGEVVVTDKQGVYNYVQGLSGGERSKALVFFIMAMWKITDMPFHVLDEFEACLDDQSRKDIHEKIIQHAKKHSESQFFILTPLELIGIPLHEEEFVKVIHIKKRN